MRLGIRCDVGQGVGVGHLMRSLALSEAFQRANWSVEVAADTTTVPLARQRLEAANVASVGIPRSSADHGRWIADSALDAVILDSYLLAPEASRAMLEIAPVLTFIDGSTRGQSASMYLDQNFGSESSAWPPAGEAFAAKTPRLAGPRFTILSDELLALRPDAPETQSNSPRLLVALGGTDALGLTPLLVQAIALANVQVDVTVISTAGARSFPRFETVDARFEYREPTNDFPDLLAHASAVIFAAGSSLWEAASLGKPVAALAVAPNQSETYRRLAGEEMIYGLGDTTAMTLDPHDLSNSIRSFLSDVGLRTRLAESSFSLIDGRGKSRVYAAFSTLLAGA